MKIAVVGTGYVGLVTAVCLAHWGLDGRNCYSPAAVQGAGIVYDCIGRPRVLPADWAEQTGRVFRLPADPRKAAPALRVSP